MFIPFSLPGNRRMPPVLRRGYHITTKTLHNLIRGEGYEEVPVVVYLLVASIEGSSNQSEFEMVWKKT